MSDQHKKIQFALGEGSQVMVTFLRGAIDKSAVGKFTNAVSDEIITKSVGTSFSLSIDRSSFDTSVAKRLNPEDLSQLVPSSITDESAALVRPLHDAMTRLLFTFDNLLDEAYNSTFPCINGSISRTSRKGLPGPALKILLRSGAEFQFWGYYNPNPGIRHIRYTDTQGKSQGDIFLDDPDEYLQRDIQAELRTLLNEVEGIGEPITKPHLESASSESYNSTNKSPTNISLHDLAQVETPTDAENFRKNYSTLLNKEELKDLFYDVKKCFISESSHGAQEALNTLFNKYAQYFEEGVSIDHIRTYLPALAKITRKKKPTD